MKRLIIGQKTPDERRIVIGNPTRKSVQTVTPLAAVPSPRPAAEKTAYVKTDDGQFLIVCEGQKGSDVVTGKLAVPNYDGLIVKTETDIEVTRDQIVEFDGVIAPGKAKSFDSTTPFEIDTGKGFSEVKDADGTVVDVKNVTISGLGSTFVGTTKRDRDGDYILPGAFDKTLAEFRTNPVMLVDHENSVLRMAGSFSKVGVTEQGLVMEGRVSNSPAEFMKHVRFLIHEGHLKAFSIGGIFFYDESGYGVEEIRLFETSLVAVPANQDALFSVRKIGRDDAVKCFSQFQKRQGANLQFH